MTRGPEARQAAMVMTEAVEGKKEELVTGGTGSIILNRSRYCCNKVSASVWTERGSQYSSQCYVGSWTDEGACDLGEEA